MKKYGNNTPMAKSDAKFEEKLALASKNDMSTLVNFNAISDKCEIFFDLYFEFMVFRFLENELNLCIESMWY